MISYENYAKFRNSQGMKDSDVAKKAGIPQSTFSDWKKGKSAPKTEKIKKIADALNTTPAHIVGWTENECFTESEINFTNDMYAAAAENKKWSWLDENEQDLVKSYREFDEEAKRQLVLMLAFIKDQQNKK